MSRHVEVHFQGKVYKPTKIQFMQYIEFHKQLILKGFETDSQLARLDKFLTNLDNGWMDENNKFSEAEQQQLMPKLEEWRKQRDQKKAEFLDNLVATSEK